MHHHIVPSGSIHHFCFWPFWPPFWPLLKVGLDVVFSDGFEPEQHDRIRVRFLWGLPGSKFSFGGVTQSLGGSKFGFGEDSSSCLVKFSRGSGGSKFNLDSWLIFQSSKWSKFRKFRFDPTLKLLLWVG